jgi:protein-S-isoprenylcysteine O-methyltransferase Ste14
MQLLRALLQSAVLSGRVSALIVFGALSLFMVFHFVRMTQVRGIANYRDSMSFWGVFLSLIFGAFVPLCVWRRWGDVSGLVPQPVLALAGIIGSVMCFMALSFVVWGFLTLGPAGYAQARLDRGAQLRTDGPYQFVRHPVYFGFGLLFVGAGLAGLSWWAMAAGLLWWPLAFWRARMEENLLRQAFGHRFDEYALKVPLLIPKFHS